MKRMNLKFRKIIIILTNQYKILEIRKCYSIALMFTFNML